MFGTAFEKGVFAGYPPNVTPKPMVSYLALTRYFTRAIILAKFEVSNRNHPLRMRHISVWAILSILLQTSRALAGQTGSIEVPDFEDVTQSAGLVVSHISTPDKKYMVESMSGGVGFIDCNNDSKLDIITVNGSTVDRYKAGGDRLITLYQQVERLRFKDITSEAGLNRQGWGMGIAVADFDNDGWEDIYITGFGGSALYRNKGNCRFEDVTARARVNADGFPAGAAWGDYDRDGLIDLFVPRYAHIEDKSLGKDAPLCKFMGLDVFCGPWGFPGETDLLFHNRGDSTFEEVSKKAGVGDNQLLFGMQGIWADFDDDGWPDLYVANDRGPNYLYHNKHDGTFEDVSVLAGTAVSADGHAQGSMGLDTGDFDHNGELDIFATNFQQESDTLYRNLGLRGFDDISVSSGIAQATFSYVGWGTGFVDFTNSGWDDIFVANGHIYPQIDQAGLAFRYREPLLLFHNNRDGTFTDIRQLTMLDQLPLHSRRGVAFGDINNDGKVDVLILNIGEPPTLLVNCTRSVNHAVLVKLAGTKSNRAGIGGRVIVTSGDLKQQREVHGGGSYLSQNDLRLHFGSGSKAKIDTMEVAWPSGSRQTLRDLAADLIYTIEEGKGIRSATPFAESESCSGGDPPAKAGLPAK